MILPVGKSPFASTELIGSIEDIYSVATCLLISPSLCRGDTKKDAALWFWVKLFSSKGFCNFRLLHSSFTNRFHFLHGGSAFITYIDTPNQWIEVSLCWLWLVPQKLGLFVLSTPPSSRQSIAKWLWTEEGILAVKWSRCMSLRKENYKTYSVWQSLQVRPYYF